ncbi:MAG: hypothetical protein IJ341_09870 [Bacteroidales bacterium]|nr:hypothetical protein [Bacteroidales bacterium]
MCIWFGSAIKSVIEIGSCVLGSFIGIVGVSGFLGVSDSSCSSTEGSSIIPCCTSSSGSTGTS